ncbi:uncharacterized protein LOC21411467 [Morus notabilis]|uniref:uncharacterized protein LOC21411467 n=1 Tax=Morus notabilis TaxID=981085 RepID=UPI000CED03A0|nr:uncharacterized protein LOC21411467 [Morus notabilis]
MLERFDFVMLPDIKKVIDDQMKDSHRSWRCSLRKYFKKIGGEISPEIAKRLPPDDIINYENWEWLCDYWSTEEQIELSKQNMKNRLTNKGYNSSHGSKSYPAHREELAYKFFISYIYFFNIFYSNSKYCYR